MAPLKCLSCHYARQGVFFSYLSHKLLCNVLISKSKSSNPPRSTEIPKAITQSIATQRKRRAVQFIKDISIIYMQTRLSVFNCSRLQLELRTWVAARVANVSSGHCVCLDACHGKGSGRRRGALSSGNYWMTKCNGPVARRLHIPIHNGTMRSVRNLFRCVAFRVAAFGVAKCQQASWEKLVSLGNILDYVWRWNTLYVI